MALGSSHMTITTGANFIPELWSKEVQIAAESNLVAGKLSKEFTGEIKSKGDTLHVPLISNLTAASKSASTQVSFSSPTETTVDLLINANYQISFLIERILDAQSAYNLSTEYGKKAQYGLAKQIDTDLLGLYANITQSVGTATVPPGDNEFRRAVQYQDDADVPMTGRAFIMSPSAKNSFLGIDRYVSQDFTGTDLPVKTGLFGQRYGIPFYTSTNTPSANGGYVNQLIHEETYCYARQKDVNLMTGPVIEYVADGWVYTVLYGVKTYRANFGVQVLS